MKAAPKSKTFAAILPIRSRFLKNFSWLGLHIESAKKFPTPVSGITNLIWRALAHQILIISFASQMSKICIVILVSKNYDDTGSKLTCCLGDFHIKYSAWNWFNFLLVTSSAEVDFWSVSVKFVSGKLHKVEKTFDFFVSKTFVADAQNVRIFDVVSIKFFPPSKK